MSTSNCALSAPLWTGARAQNTHSRNEVEDGAADPTTCQPRSWRGFKTDGALGSLHSRVAPVPVRLLLVRVADAAEKGFREVMPHELNAVRQPFI